MKFKVKHINNNSLDGKTKEIKELFGMLLHKIYKVNNFKKIIKFAKNLNSFMIYIHNCETIQESLHILGPLQLLKVTTNR